MTRYIVWFLDVWGNENDGWDVNDRSKLTEINIPLDATDQEILAAVSDYALSYNLIVSSQSDRDLMFIDHKENDKPFLQLDRETIGTEYDFTIPDWLPYAIDYGPDELSDDDRLIYDKFYSRMDELCPAEKTWLITYGIHPYFSHSNDLSRLGGDVIPAIVHIFE